MDDHGVADLDVGHAGADLVDPARVLVAGHVGEHDLGLLRPLALLDVQVGAAQPGRADLHDHVERPEDLRLVDLLDLQRARGTRAGARPSCRDLLLVRAVSNSQQIAAHAAVGLQRQADEPCAAQPRRQVRDGQRRAVAGDERGASASRGRPSAARSAATARGVGAPAGPRRAAPRPSRAWRRRLEQRLAHARLAGDQRLALEQLAQRVQRARASRPGTRRRSARRARPRR